MKMKLASFVLLIPAAGCAGLDPWDEYDGAAPSPSAPYATRTLPVAVPPPNLRGKTLGLADCLRIALERHPATRSSWLASRSAAARVGEERGAYFPRASLRAAGSRGDTLDSRNEDKSPRNEFSASFGLRYLLYDGGNRYARVRGAEAELLGANFRHNAQLQEVGIGVQVNYYDCLAAASLVGVAEDAARQAQAHVDLARARQRAGLVARFDVLKAETEKADADLNLVRTRSGVRVAHARLAQAMGLRVDESFEIEDVTEDAREQVQDEVAQLLAEASRNRPELRAARALIDARRSDVSSARSEFLPKITAGADYGWRDSQEPIDGKEWFVGIGIELPLFNGFSSSYQLDRAFSETKRASADLELALRGVELEVWVAHSRFAEAGEAIGAAENLVASAEESARVAEGMYRAGAGSIIELTDSLASRTGARTRLVQARLDWRTALARLERAVGRTMSGAKQ